MNQILTRFVLGFAAFLSFVGAALLAAFILFGNNLGIAMAPWHTVVPSLEHAGHASVIASVICLFLGFTLWEHEQVRRRQRARRGNCPGCDYDRRGTEVSAPCPECGESAPVEMKGRTGGIWPMVLIAGLFVAARALRVVSGVSWGC